MSQIASEPLGTDFFSSMTCYLSSDDIGNIYLKVTFFLQMAGNVRRWALEFESWCLNVVQKRWRKVDLAPSRSWTWIANPKIWLLNPYIRRAICKSKWIICSSLPLYTQSPNTKLCSKPLCDRNFAHILARWISHERGCRVAGVLSMPPSGHEQVTD